MAKKQMLTKRNRNPETPVKTKTEASDSPKTTSKHSNKNGSRMTEIANGYASSEETDFAVGHSSSMGSLNNEVVDSSAVEDGGVERNSSSDVEEEEEQLKSVRKRGKKDDAKNKGKKRSGKEEGELEEEERANALYTFPMRRISQIIKCDTPDLKISQEAVFVINNASEKFLQLFCKEAYACTFLDKKKHTAYNHLASVVSKRKRFEFLSDIVPAKVKVGDALAQLAEAEK